jgi:hypothetical protein
MKRMSNSDYRTCNYTDQVSVIVGPHEQLFIVHRDVICARSKFFRAACSERWLRGKEKRVTLPDVEPSAFQSYLGWVYSGQLEVSSVSSEAIDANVKAADRELAKHVSLYMLGDVIDDVRLRNKAMQGLVKDTGRIPLAHLATSIWEKTPANSPIRKMIVDRATLRTPRAFLTQNLSTYPVDFIVQLANSLAGKVLIASKEAFEGGLPSYLEPTEQVE